MKRYSAAYLVQRRAEGAAVITTVASIPRLAPHDGIIERDEAGTIVSVVTGGITKTFTYDEAGNVVSVSDGVKTMTVLRDESGAITGWEAV